MNTRTYTLRFPFQLPANQEISVGDHSCGNLHASLRKESTHYVLTISGFSSESAARAYATRAWAGLMWFLLQKNLSPFAAVDIQEVTLADDPNRAAANLSTMFGTNITTPVDALIDGSRPAVYASDKHIETLTMGSTTIRVTNNAQEILSLFEQATTFPHSAEVYADAKLRVAIELFGSSFTEHSANARFLALVISLETLATAVPKAPRVRALLEKWTKEVEELQKSVDSKSEDADSLEAIKRELLFRQEDSLRRQIRRLVRDTLRSNKDDDAEEVAARAVKTYDRRSELVHNGCLKPGVLQEAINDAKNIAERVLRIRFYQSAKPIGDIGAKDSE